MKTHDLIIIGSGPAGLTASIYAARYKMNFLVIGKNPGGLLGEAYEICNFPSYTKIKGNELMKKIIWQVKEMGVKVKNGEVLKIKKKQKSFELTTNKGKYFAKKIILATGSERKKLGLAGEKKFTGRGLSYCATCDAGFYKDKIAGVVGGSDAALTAALVLANFAKKVYIIYRKNKFFRGDKIWIKEVKKNKKIEPIFNSVVTKLIGKERLKGVELNKKRRLELDGLFVEVGGIPNIELAEELGIKTENKQIIVDKKQKTNIKDIFAAGDITNNSLKQIITACAEGAVAVNSAYKELVKER